MFEMKMFAVAANE